MPNNPIYAAAENLSALYDSVLAFDQSWRLTQEFTDPGSSVAASISCSAADALENLLSALGLEVLAHDFRVAHVHGDAGDFGDYHADWAEAKVDTSDPFADQEGELTAETLYDDDDDDECEGHEWLAGAHMGETVYCDGTCR